VSVYVSVCVCVCVCVCAHVCSTCSSQKRASDPLALVLLGLVSLPLGFMALNFSVLQEQQALLTPELSLQPLIFVCSETGLILQPRLTWNSLCSELTTKSYINLLNVGMTSMSHHAQLTFTFEKSKTV
jgi:NhaP-type Na+/H+ or K+/H+ antiporter